MKLLAERPRELRWYHAAGLLFGDWGTSRLYVLGFAFVLSGHASFWYVAAMCVLVALVGFSYTIVCAHFPDGGGVYSVAKPRSSTLAVVGALLLVANYVITAALSAYAGFRYILPSGVDSRYALYAAVVALLIIGAANMFGPRRAGLWALGVAIASAFFYLIVSLFCLPTLGHAAIVAPQGSLGDQWSQFVNVILALSGVEAIANMTGVMAEPVAKNARKAIFVVLLEVVVLNLLLAYAMNALPELMHVDLASLKPVELEDWRDHMVKNMAAHFVGGGFAAVASVFFGVLLLSAANTAIGDMVSTQYLMARDKELPAKFTILNRHGMPWVGLIFATLAPITTLLLVGNDTATLADLYAIGVVGAIAINLGVCGTNSKLNLKRWEQATLLAVGGIVALIWVTIAYQKPSALLFASIILGLGLFARAAVKKAKAHLEKAAERKVVTESAVRAVAPMNVPRLLVSTRGGNPKLMKFATGYAKEKGAALFVLFVREVALSFKERGEKVGAEHMTLANDPEAQRIFEEARKLGEESGVPVVPLYSVYDSPAEMILDHAATLGVDAVLMGVSQRGAFWKTMRGDILQEVIQYMPKNISLLIHA